VNLQPRITFEGEEATTIAGFVAEGLGITVLPKISDIQNDTIRYITLRIIPAKEV
jgi:DNA-binding transcriptional LysR family regulator